MVSDGRVPETKSMSMSADTRRQFELEEQAYWRQREKLLTLHHGKWVAIVAGEMVAIGDEMNKVAEEAFRKTDSNVMFVSHVGEEDTEFRIRQLVACHSVRQNRRALPTIDVSVSA